MAELTKILRDEAWLESERRGGSEVPLSDEDVYTRSVKIWEEEHEKQNKRVVPTEDDYYSI